LSELLTAGHLAPLAVIGVAAAGAGLAVRRDQSAVRLITGLLAIWVLAAEVVWPLELLRLGRWSPQLGLPLQLCDAATLVAAAALLSRWWPLAELTYFWACAGSLQALLTPDLPQGFPDLLYFQYYAAHGGVVVAALLLVWGLGLTPRRGAVARAFFATAGFTALVGIVDALIGANYMYLRQPPPTPTLLAVLGPWPWYLASAAGVALGLLLLLDAPFRLARRRRRSDLDLAARDLLDQRSQLAP
jgi:hypothetical integral membrane protein (TIGR02206 family)